METRDGEDKSIENILQEIFINYGFNIWDYSLSYLQSKISKRMSALNITDLLEYARYVQFNPNEHKVLYNTILDRESIFFRDPDAWNFVKDSVLPNILQNAESSIDRTIRLWSIGCSSGEEPYSLAIMLAEVLKNDILKYKIKLYATDIDETSLTVARNGTYIPEQLSEISDTIKEKYFIHRGNFYTISPEIRRLIIFGKHNIISDPPITNIDLILCRNVLIYLDPKLKSRIIHKLRYALNDKGYLWFGRGEDHIDSNLYGLKPLNTNWRIFKKTSYQDHFERKKFSATNQSIINEVKQLDELNKLQPRKGIIILDGRYKILSYDPFSYHFFIQNSVARYENTDSLNTDYRWKYNRMVNSDQELSFFDLDICYQIADLENKVKYAVDKNEFVMTDEVEYILKDGRETKIKIEIIPIPIGNSNNRGAVILFEDISRQYELQKRLQMTIESLEVSNENLALSNAVLKSTTEELEIINEYLQSKNSEELMVISEELAERSSELEILKLYYELLVNEIGYGIIVVDDKLSVVTANRIALDIFEIEGNLYNKSFSDISTHINLSSIFEHTLDVIKTGKPNKYIFGKQSNNKICQMFEISIIPVNRNKTEGAILIIRECP